MAERILCVLGKLKAGGVESMMYAYFEQLDKEKYLYDFVYEDGSEFDVPQRLISMGARAFKVPKVSSCFKYVKALRALIKENKYTIVHCNVNTLSVFSLYAAKACKVRCRICHNHSTSSNAEKKRDIIKKLLRPFNKALATNWCACSELAGRWMYGDQAFDSGKVTVFRNGVNCARFSYDPAFRNEIRSEFDLENKTVIGHIGRFMTQKNHLFLIDIFKKYSDINKDSVLLLVGGGERFDEVKAYVESHGLSDKVIFAGFRNSDVNKFYSAFDIFVLPSLYEGLPVVSVEACAAGLPVLLSEFVTPEAAITDKVRFLPIDDADLWAREIQNNLNSDRDNIASQMKDGGFNIVNCVKELEAYYDMCLNAL